MTAFLFLQQVCHDVFGAAVQARFLPRGNIMLQPMRKIVSENAATQYLRTSSLTV